jgi:predicted component of type VI protein secretion system
MIFVEQKPSAGQEHPVADGTTIGREGCDLNLIDQEVSRRHAAIRSADGSLAIEDLGSTNGTFVNDERITGTRVLSHGDTVRLGNTVWTVRADEATAVQPVAAGVTAAQASPAAVPEPEPEPAAAAAAAEPAGRRGDVEAPPEVAPSAIRRVLPPPAAGQAPQFSPPGARPGGSAATRVDVTIVCMVAIAAVAVALIVYFATY